MISFPKMTYKNIPLYILIYCLATNLSATPYQPTYSDMLMVAGEKSYKEKDLMGAIYYLDSCILLNPKNDQCRYTRGKVAYEMKNYDLGKKMFKDVLVLVDYKDPVVWNMLGLCCMELKQYDSAEFCFKNAVRINPDESRFYANWGKNEVFKGNLTHAEQLYNTAVFLDPNYMPHALNRAEVQRKMGKEKEALDELKKISESNPNNQELQSKIESLEGKGLKDNLPYMIIVFALIIGGLWYFQKRKKVH